ncbi:hypothetical protein C5C07_20035 [Haloferax sp. Atlit-4N]|uniref:hypothetical protein n=1 Tax=Haloferax sp. Atlit-4N TaxID=2077206 RepID=UPI000E23AE33|nr:hypothetical protein [Haloferax sp. Atlit-4N]RDZ49823.1 hypothetical protein C5C07_20035 [Haloferax sp. Atlit-4N]
MTSGHRVSGPEPGVQFTDSPPVDADARLHPSDLTPTGLWRVLFDPWSDRTRFAARFVESLREHAAGMSRAEFYADLDGVGIDALQGAYARVCEWLLSDRDSPTFWRGLEVTRSLGSGRPLGLRTYRDDVRRGPLALLRHVDVVPTVVVHLDAELFDREACRRPEEFLGFLSDLGETCAVRVVSSGYVRARLWTEYREALPSSVSESANPRLSEQASSRVVERLVREARGDLSNDSRTVQILRDVAAEASETLSYHALQAKHSTVSRSRVSQCVNLLEDHDLLETFSAPGGRRASLLPAGREYLEILNEEYGVQKRLSEVFPDGVSEPPKPSDNSRVNPNGHGEAERVDRRRMDGLVDVAYLSCWEHAAVASVSPPETPGVSLVDRPIPKKEDRREPAWSYDPEADHVVVSAEFDNPMQWWVCVARALTDWKMWDNVLTPARLDGEAGDLSGLSLDDATLLRGTRCLGYLKDADANGAAYVEALEAARDNLLDMTRALSHGDYEDRNRFRGAILREALGLAGTVVHLLDLAGVSVSREVRLPEFSRNFSEDRRADLVRTVAKGVTIQSRYGHFSAHRQLHEQRAEKREVPSPSVDAADPFGTLIGGFVLVGPGVSDLEDLLHANLERPAEVHEDAPGFGIRVPVRTDHGRGAYARAALAMCDHKDLEATREAVGILQAFTSTPYDAARALHGLGREKRHPGRRVRVDEIRYALSTLPTEALLPFVAPSARKVVHALLTADGPLSVAETASRADVSTQSVRNHRDRLLAFDLLRETPEGLRVPLTGPTDRDTDADAVDGEPVEVLPWYATPTGERTGEARMRNGSLLGVYRRAVEWLSPADRWSDRGDPVGRFYAEWPPDFDLIRDEWPWLQEWEDALQAMCADVHPVDPREDADVLEVSDDTSTGDGGGVRVATFGAVPTQRALPGVVAT